MRECNALLGLAGLPPRFDETPAGRGTTAPFLAALEHTLESHAPYPGVIVNGWWDIVRLNAPARRLLGPVDGENLAEAVLHPAMRERVVDFEPFARAILGRLRRDARHAPFDTRLEALCASVEAVVGPESGDSTAICPAFRVDGGTVRTFSLVGELTSAHDITLEELRVELLYPADEDSATLLRGL